VTRLATRIYGDYRLGTSPGCNAQRLWRDASMSVRIDTRLVCAALQSVYWQRTSEFGLIVHTDRGSKYASDEYCRLAAIMSMNRKGNAWDGVGTESLFKTLKVECIHKVRVTIRMLRHDWTSSIGVRACITGRVCTWPLRTSFPSSVNAASRPYESLCVETR
jgi:transposase InsO family protein